MDDSLVAKLNWQWAQGAPADDITKAGLLVHVLDGMGINGRGFYDPFAKKHTGLPPVGEKLWYMVGRAQIESSRAKLNKTMAKLASHALSARASCSIISRSYPFHFSPHNMQMLRAGYGRMPHLILNTNATEVRRRVSCCYSMDVGTLGMALSNQSETCEFSRLTGRPILRMGGKHEVSCPMRKLPGCVTKPLFILPTHSKSGACKGGRCHKGPFPRLRSCLLHMDIPSCSLEAASLPPSRPLHYCARAYNEVVLDISLGGQWDMRKMATALGINHDASNASISLARAVHCAAASDGVHVPLLWYNESAASEPYSILDEGRSKGA
uniref:Uncharacterized protein n=1 Tax=Calcidiscus leptoporus TaxID=127549 RepID=A0A7S0J220_9EUKA|mmetsp:Transcript_35113/g.82148  ORF Transcript_35113/g.82148 Transcript_35113/m.82148 type:complete len:325 (+) Transcript_35113:185-1159(+)